MALNKYMHPRNIYKTPPNFKQLAIDYPEFRKYAKQDISGKVTIDFKDINALRALTITLLKKDFDLDVDIPLDRLIPTVPLRLNYVLWIEDLISISSSGADKNPTIGIDIGTGASCIYPLIVAKSNEWKMVATEVEPASIGYARRNVTNNKLDDLIRIKEVDKNTVLSDVLVGNEDRYDFCMCNPPFFTSLQELNPFFKSRTNRRALPRNANAAASGEVVTKGGEVEFIGKLLRESATFKTRVRIYSTMVGHKSSLPILKSLLRQLDVVSFKQTEFCQGHTTRWGLAWTYCALDLRTIPQETLCAAATKKKTKPPLRYTVTTGDSDTTLSDVAEKVANILTSLEMDVLKYTAKNKTAFNATACKETWTNQRRKRREQIRAEQRTRSIINSSTSSPEAAASSSSSSLPNSPGVSEAASLLSEIDMDREKGVAKRCLDENYGEDGYYNVKKIKLEPHYNSERPYVLKCVVIVRRVESDVVLEMSLSNGSDNRESMHQLMQYFKNNLK